MRHTRLHHVRKANEVGVEALKRARKRFTERRVARQAADVIAAGIEAERERSSRTGFGFGTRLRDEI